VTVHEDLHGAHDGKNAGEPAGSSPDRSAAARSRGPTPRSLTIAWRCDFMNTVKKEEEPAEVGFSATRLGLERVLEKKRYGGKIVDPVNSDH